MSHDPTALPANLAIPVDDGAADHLPGTLMPATALTATDGTTVDLRAHSAGRRLSSSPIPAPAGPASTRPRAGTTSPAPAAAHPEACSFRDLTDLFTAAGEEVFGLSTQGPDYQLEAATRLQLPYPLLSDADLQLTTALRLPTFTVDGMTLLRRLPMIVRDGAVERVRYPVFPPDQVAADALDALTR